MNGGFQVLKGHTIALKYYKCGHVTPQKLLEIYSIIIFYQWFSQQNWFEWFIHELDWSDYQVQLTDSVIQLIK